MDLSEHRLVDQELIRALEIVGFALIFHEKEKIETFIAASKLLNESMNAIDREGRLSANIKPPHRPQRRNCTPNAVAELVSACRPDFPLFPEQAQFNSV